MFRPDPMTQIDVLLLQRDLPEASRSLAGAGILHLRLAAKDYGVAATDRAADRHLARRCRAFAAQLNHLLELLHIEQEGGQYLGLEDFPLWERRTVELTEKIERIIHRREELQRRDRLLESLGSLCGSIGELDADFDELRALRWARLVVGTLSEEECEKLRAANFPIALFPLQENPTEPLVAILTSRRHAPRLEKQLAEFNFRAIEIPAGLRGPLKEVHRRLQHARSRTGQRVAKLEAKLAGSRVENRSWLQDRLWTANAEQRMLEARESFGYTDRAAILCGWLPENRFGDLMQVLQESCDGRFVVRQAVAHGDGIPVQLRNPPCIRPFQKILAVYGTPTYEEIEPTPLLALGFLLMFGMMFGDLGHGLIFITAGLLAKRYTGFRDQGVLLAEMGCFAALFGLLFGSFFGREDLFPPLWFSPMHDVPLLMGAALLLGVAMVLTGLALRVVNGLRQGPFLVLLTDRFGLAGMLFYGGAVATASLVYLEMIPAAVSWWLVIPLFAIFLHPFAVAEGSPKGEFHLLLVEGIIEVLETVLGYLANTFSFLRVAAFGLAHVGLSLAVFAVADKVQDAPLGMLWVVLVQVTGNLIIVALEGLVVTVQTVRLEFYEFFSKFFRGGGVEYRPLTLDSGLERRT